MFEVTAPMVVVRAHGRTVYKTAGQIVEGLSEADADRLTALGMIVPAGEAAAAPAQAAVPASAEPEPTPVSDGEKPKRTAPLAAWQAYAKTAGLSDEDIDGATKAELIAAIG